MPPSFFIVLWVCWKKASSHSHKQLTCLLYYKYFPRSLLYIGLLFLLTEKLSIGIALSNKSTLIFFQTDFRSTILQHCPLYFAAASPSSTSWLLMASFPLNSICIVLFGLIVISTPIGLILLFIFSGSFHIDKTIAYSLTKVLKFI